MFNKSTHRVFVLFFLGLFLHHSSFSQGAFSIEAGMGIADYIGDLKYQTGNPQEWGGAFSIATSYHLSEQIHIRLGFNQGTISGDDRTTGDPGRQQRNLHFKNNLKEIELVMKFNFLKPPRFQAYSKGRTHFSPYVFGGVAALFSNPVAKLDGQWYELQPLGTEGQYIPGSELSPYTRTQATFPLGIGLGYRVSKTVLSLEMGYRRTFTDYLDDVSTVYPDRDALIEASGLEAAQLSSRADNLFTAGDKRGNAMERDSYFFVMFRIGVLISGR